MALFLPVYEEKIEEERNIYGEVRGTYGREEKNEKGSKLDELADSSARALGIFSCIPSASQVTFAWPERDSSSLSDDLIQVNRSFRTAVDRNEE